MPEAIHEGNGRLTHPNVRSEKSDASFRWILGLIVGALVAGSIIYAGVMRFFIRHRDYEAAIKKSPFPLAPAPAATLPRPPVLEQVQRLPPSPDGKAPSVVIESSTPNIYNMQASKLAELGRYGPSAEKGYIHVPISRAMTYLENKLPARTEPPIEQRRRARGLFDAGESNSGRVFREGRK